MSWAIVATAKASPREIARFAAHHLALGCAQINIYLDGVEPPQIAHPQLYFHQGTQEHSALNSRQMANATHAYERCASDWLAHIDLDEFIIAHDDINTQLSALHADIAWAKILPVELLEPASGPEQHYKRAPQHVGLARALLEDLYPDYGLTLRTGFISHSDGKAFVRTGLKGARIGVHKLRGQKWPQPATLHADLAHHHAPTWVDFEAHLERRLTGTSYTAAREGDISIGDLIRIIRDEFGMTGVRQFYETLRRATSDHLATLEQHGLLVTHDLQLDKKARSLFPELFEAKTA